MMDDLISRQAAIDAINDVIVDYIPTLFGYLQEIPLELALAIERLPAAEPSAILMKVEGVDVEGVDKESLRKAMEEAELTLLPAESEIIRCKECVYYENETHGLCDLGGEWAPDDYCSYGRRPKHG